MKRTLVRNRRLYLESGSAIRCTTAPRRAASKVRRVRIRGSASGRAPCRQATRAGVGSTSAVESVLISSPWRDVVAPLAGDRSLRGLAAMKRLRTDQREALHARLSVREYRRGETVYRPGGHARSLYVVLAGVARLSIPAPNGRSVLIHLLPAGEIFGHTALRSEERRVGKEWRDGWSPEY